MNLRNTPYAKTTIVDVFVTFSQTLTTDAATSRANRGKEKKGAPCPLDFTLQEKTLTEPGRNAPGGASSG